MQLGHESWSDQFVEAMNVNGGKNSLNPAHFQLELSLTTNIVKSLIASSIILLLPWLSCSGV